MFILIKAVFLNIFAFNGKFSFGICFSGQVSYQETDFNILNFLTLLTTDNSVHIKVVKGNIKLIIFVCLQIYFQGI